MSSGVYDPTNYWENRLQTDFDLDGVGFQKRGLSLNKWMYKSMLYSLKNALDKHKLEIEGKSICEIGCGTGFYLPFWISQKPSMITGWDITSISVQRLVKKFPQYVFEQRDISQPINNGKVPQFDIVTAISVLFHIVDQTSFKQAIANLGKITQLNGRLIISDYFWRYGKVATRSHVKYHSLAEYKVELEKAGLVIEELYPQTFFMNPPMDFRSAAVRYLAFFGWTGVTYLGNLKKVSDILGQWAYQKDVSLIDEGRDTPSTKIMICRKIG